MDYAPDAGGTSFLQRVFDHAPRLPALRVLELSCVHPDFPGGFLLLNSSDFCRPGLCTTVKLATVHIDLERVPEGGSHTRSGGAGAPREGARLHMAGDCAIGWPGGLEALPALLCPDALQECVLDATYLAFQLHPEGREWPLDAVLRVLLAERASGFAFSVASKPARLATIFAGSNYAFLDPLVRTLSWQRWPPAGCAAWQAASAQHGRAAAEAAAWVAFQKAMGEGCGSGHGSDSGGAQETGEPDAGADGYDSDQKYGPGGWIYDMFDGALRTYEDDPCCKYADCGAHGDGDDWV